MFSALFLCLKKQDNVYFKVKMFLLMFDEPNFILCCSFHLQIAKFPMGGYHQDAGNDLKA